MERRENFLEDQSELNLLKQGKVSPSDFFNYYLGYCRQPERHQPRPQRARLGRAVRAAVGDEHRDQRPSRGRQGRGRGRAATSRWAATRSAARSRPPTRPGTSTVRPGGRDLSGLVLIDGASSPTAGDARAGADVAQRPADLVAVAELRRASRRRWRDSSAWSARRRRRRRRTALSVFDGWPLLPSNLQPPPGVNPTNEAGFGLSD